LPRSNLVRLLWWRFQAQVAERGVTVHYASGYGGQFIFVVPELEIVAAFTGENHNSPKAGLAGQILVQVILPSVR
jgi:hypothetical protein